MLVLASGSPRRRQLLAQLGVQFRVETTEVDECRLTGERPQDMTVRLALLKAHSVYDKIGGGHPVLGGDTTVSIDDQALGKPVDRDHAMTMLQRLSGDTHMVFSAVALVTAGHQLHNLSITEVTFGRISQRQLDQYCDSAEPFDKAGAYGIQGVAGAFVRHIKGSYSGVVGLPLWHTRQLLDRIDYP
jgi:septum formation protein